jgi:hypothetical protein
VKIWLNSSKFFKIEVFCSTLLFDGVRVDFAKPLNEKYSLHHSFQMGSQIAPSSYSFQPIYGDVNSVLSGQIDSAGNLHGRTQNTWKVFTAKTQVNFFFFRGINHEKLPDYKCSIVWHWFWWEILHSN